MITVYRNPSVDGQTGPRSGPRPPSSLLTYLQTHLATCAHSQSLMRRCSPKKLSPCRSLHLQGNLQVRKRTFFRTLWRRATQRWKFHATDKAVYFWHGMETLNTRWDSISPSIKYRMIPSYYLYSSKPMLSTKKCLCNTIDQNIQKIISFKRKIM